MKKAGKDGKKHTTDKAVPKDFSKLPLFNDAMKKITSVAKEEIERREQAERDAKSSSK